MITFDLECGNGHRFEGWFASREAFDGQREARMILCPLCDSRQVVKRPSAFAVHVGKGEGEPPKVRRGEAAGQNPVSYFRELKRFVDDNFENVGQKFAEEALKIKNGEAPSRSLSGTTTDAEEENLREEGVEFFKLALPKYDA